MNLIRRSCDRLIRIVQLRRKTRHRAAFLVVCFGKLMFCLENRSLISIPKWKRQRETDHTRPFTSLAYVTRGGRQSDIRNCLRLLQAKRGLSLIGFRFPSRNFGILRKTQREIFQTGQVSDVFQVADDLRKLRLRAAPLCRQMLAGSDQRSLRLVELNPRRSHCHFTARLFNSRGFARFDSFANIGNQTGGELQVFLPESHPFLRTQDLRTPARSSSKYPAACFHNPALQARVQTSPRARAQSVCHPAQEGDSVAVSSANG